MEMTLFTKNKENWTRFKVGVKQIYTIPPKVLLVLGEPTKKTNRGLIKYKDTMTIEIAKEVYSKFREIPYFKNRK